MRGPMSPTKRMQGWREAMLGGAKLGDMKIDLMAQTHDIFQTDMASDKWLCPNPGATTSNATSAPAEMTSTHPKISFVEPNSAYHVRLVDEFTHEVMWDETFDCMTKAAIASVWKPKMCSGVDDMVRSVEATVPFTKICLAKNDGNVHWFDLSIESNNYKVEKWMKNKGVREGLHYLDGAKGHVLFTVRRKPQIEFKDKVANDGWDSSSYLAPHPYVGLTPDQCEKLALPAEELYPSLVKKPETDLWEDRSMGPLYPTKFERRLAQHEEATQKGDDDGKVLGGRGYYHHIVDSTYPMNPKNVEQWDFDGRTPIAPASKTYSIGPKPFFEDTPWINRHPSMSPEKYRNFLEKLPTQAETFL
eukprot:GEMP01045656.1.p1 GENE.GEMP01045656.1~~GEMP01045656.1.p1  ORF type:complete len:360 (+),score=72.60 GEMP01045656.1:364-1443(+)